VTVRAALRDGTFWWLAVAFVLSMLATTALTIHLVAFLLDEGYGATFAAAVAGAHGMLSVFGRFVITAADRFLPRSRSGAFLVGLQMAALIVLLLWRDAVGVILFEVLFGASAGAMTVTRPALLADYYGRTSYGAIAGTMALLQSSARMLAPVGAGLAYGLVGSYDPVFWGLVGATGVATVAMVRAERSHEHHERELVVAVNSGAAWSNVGGERE
jgi:cyanate permease